ncbi:fimbrial protein [Serratia aquatilis]|uniref:Fimbrial protein n=1 Tax=Serratia aquatilis TaxID=1737515 RepID=A0ABV6EIK8_9GAMM
MKMNKMALAVMLVCSSISIAKAAPGGEVKFEGSITDTPCSIDPDSEKQTVKLGAVSKPGLVKGINGPERKFSIKLLNCTLDASGVPNKVSVTFTGPQGGMPGAGLSDGLLGITGVAKGASIKLIDYSNAVVTLGQKTSLQTLTNGNGNVLEFTAYLTPNPGVTEAQIVEGAFTSTANFIMNYE